MRTIFIGDVHGCRQELEDLLDVLAVGRDDRIVLVGDLVAKGPDSRGVVRLARERGLLAVRGNHDEHVLKHRRGEATKPLKPLHQQVFDSLSEDDWRWFEQLPTHLRFPELNILVVHAGLVPGVPLAQQSDDMLLTIRSVLPDGSPSRRIENSGVPWASAWTGPETIVFGHDAVRGLQQYPFAMGLDTGCVYGGALTAWLLPERNLVSVKARAVWAEPKQD